MSPSQEEAESNAPGGEVLTRVLRRRTSDLSALGWFGLNEYRHRVRHLAHRTVLLVVLLALVGSGCSDPSDEVVPPGGARTYFEALDLSTPSAAAETFLDAFARDDFMTVWLVLLPDSQKMIELSLDLLQYGVVVDHLAIPRAEYKEIYESFPPESIGTWFLFDALMLVADEYDAFVIDLSGPVRVTDETVDGDEAELSAEVAGIEGTVTLHMEKSFKGNWRVRDVTIGGEEEPPVVWPRPGP